jgi:hypothetical protein
MIGPTRRERPLATINFHEERWCDSFPRNGAAESRGGGARKEESDLDNLVADGGFESHPPR